MRISDNTEPKNVFAFFEDICAIPHGSKNTDGIAQYLTDFAKNRKLEYYRDSYNNVIIKKPATKGYESHLPIILQAHIDMVCAKTDSSNHNFLTDGLKLRIKDGYIWATDTTLGGDDGLGVAYILAILDSSGISHPAIEAVLTSDEESGMDGAYGLDASKLVTNRIINLDAAEDCMITCASASGGIADFSLPVKWEKCNNDCYKITVSGLLGGHSGEEIDKGRKNAILLCAEVLHNIPFDYSLCAFDGGTADNVIPSFCEAIISCAVDPTEIIAGCDKIIASNNEPNINITCNKVCNNKESIGEESTKAIIDFLCGLPNGVLKMSEVFCGLVHTSLSTGIAHLTDNCFCLSTLVRSAENDCKQEVLDRISDMAKHYGFKVLIKGHYPAWEYRKNSPLRETAINTVREELNIECKVIATHGGMECGILASKTENPDIISFGAEILDIHSPSERINIASAQRAYRCLLAILKAL